MFLSPGINFDEQKDDIHSVYSEIAPSEIQKFTSSINSNFQNENEKEEDEDNRHIFKSSLEEREQKEDNHCISDKEIFSEEKSGIVQQNDNSIWINRKYSDCFKINNQDSLTGIYFPEGQRNIIFEENINSQNNKINRKKLFKIIYRMQNLGNTQKVNNMLNKKRQREKKVYKGTKYLDNYNIKTKLITHFLNGFILNDNNNIIRTRCELYFERFPRNLILHFIAEDLTKELFGMALKEIYTKKELYDEKNIGSHFAHNLDVLNKLLSDDKYKYVKEQSGIVEKLEMKISDLFHEYLNSDEFKIDIDGLRIESGDAYVHKYLKIAKNL